ncbi:DUF4123 domain-containing protein [Rhodanobacter sp. C03]|uniref:DUF4123 domain-containing protein n=1 Tax=Rhodanobacter sp. C03 TaxID=1945858 RepID=UPI000985B0D0|nr:DUF4123 domain-containing protein [Rhodanobacter sp. C03]OOG55628.1 hypothetical protein B0E48_13445 [Rhodanobacter sp. C03]
MNEAMPYAHAEKVLSTLWPTHPDDGTQLYAVLDGARNDGIYPSVVRSECEFECLYTGELAPDLVRAAPYLVKLERDHAFIDALVRNGWGDSWGIFLRASIPFKQLRRHLRTFLMVYDPTIKPMYFRYYDPRVLRTFLPTCDKEQLAMMFGPALCFMLEDEDPDVLLRFSIASGSLQSQAIRMAEQTYAGSSAGFGR